MDDSVLVHVRSVVFRSIPISMDVQIVVDSLRVVIWVVRASFPVWFRIWNTHSMPDEGMCTILVHMFPGAFQEISNDNNVEIVLDISRVIIWVLRVSYSVGF